MALTTLKLDDRQFQDIVNEAKKRIPHYCEQWTDHNVSDPGVTLIELFAWMTDVILYRLNLVPDLHAIRFLEMLGIRLREPLSAQVPVTFWLSAPQPIPVTIPAGTEVASTQTETERSIVFTTDDDFQINPPDLQAALSRVTGNEGNKQAREHSLRRLAAGFEGLDIFSAVPRIDDALYLGFQNDLSNHILGLQMDFDPAYGRGIIPAQPPYVWEASTGKQQRSWEQCEVDEDTTLGMNREGRVRLHLPAMGRYKVADREMYWVRVRIIDIPADMRKEMTPYGTSPRLRRASAASWGGTIPATHAQQKSREFLGQSDGSPGQRFQIQAGRILKRLPGEALSVQVEGQPPEVWTEVPDFAGSTMANRHYTLDSTSGELRLGPAIRQPDGTIKLYGAVPPRGANLVFEKYRVGGGQEGNVRAGFLNTLKTAIPYIARVENRKRAEGGEDAETLEDAMIRAPALLRSRDRAVTEADFETLAAHAPGISVGRVKCLQPRPAEERQVEPGQVFVLIIPKVPRPEGYLAPEELRPSSEQITALSAYLDERRLLTMRVDIRPPAYQFVAVKVKLGAAPGADPAVVEAEVLRRLYRFLNPLCGWTDGKGWPFGRKLYVSDVYQCLQGIPNVQYVREVQMFDAPGAGEGRGEARDSVELVKHGVIASGLHSVEFIQD